MRSPPRPNALAWLWLSLLLIVADQASKWLAITNLEYLRPVPVIDGFWNWTLVHNYGAAFSFLSDAGGWQKWFFSGLAVVISAVMALWLRLTPRADWRNALPLALVIAGAIGNLVDRLRFGYVVDFVDWYLGFTDLPHWPTFNVADSCIVVGAVLLVLFSFKPATPAPDAR
ncbi:MAG: signal peptidase II [Arenimonas sp.]|uniref:signal peptidase II n=1 Tax=Arenimonas sp. TaxID=1872635 RepID=UPI0025B8E8A8|nr:signal peptidase II [Arenimonas sp.]MBW8367614.1 signal peptidase II [Arenimonas sp.]